MQSTLKQAKRPVLGMILKGYPRISETFISNEIRLLEQMGMAIHIISMRHPREPFCHASVRRIRAAVDYLPETLWAPLPRLLASNARLAAADPGRYAGALRTALRRFARTRKSATIKHLLQAGYLVQRVLPGRGIGHLHAHFAHSPTSVALFASRLSGLPFSFTAHAKDIYTSDPRQLREKIGLARFVVTCTDYNRQYLQSLTNGRGTAIQRVYHGIDVRLFSGPDPDENARRKPEAPYRILTVARLTAKKGLATVYHALRRMCDQGLAVEHTLIGDGDDRPQIMALIQRLGLGSCTRWLGTLPHERVLTHYRRSDLFVLGCEVAANGDRDGIPNVLLESMAMGVPVVATRVSGIPELIDSDVNGLLVPPGQPSQLAAAMARLLTDQALRVRIIPEARRRVIQHFDNRICIQDLARIYAGHVPGAGHLSRFGRQG